MKLRLNQAVYVMGDVVSASSAVLLTFGLRSDWGFLQSVPARDILLACAFVSTFTVVSGFVLGSYNSLWAFIGFSEVFKQVLIASLHAAAGVVLKLFFIPTITYSDLILFWGVLLFFTCGIRAVPRCFRWFRAISQMRSGHARRAIIIGAGAAGAMIIKRLRSNTSDGIYPVAVLDDDLHKQGIRLSGIQVCGRVSDVKVAARKHAADEIIIAIPSASTKELDVIYAHCLEACIPIKIFQSVVDCKAFIRGNKNALSELAIEDLLSRETVKPDLETIRTYVRGKTILVTGGAGSIGSEVCRQVLQYGCSRLIVFDINENGLFSLGEELKNDYSPARYSLCIGSVRDETRLDQVFRLHKPDIVFHAAAHKHVPMMENNPVEAVKNNVFGTRNVIRTSIKHHTRRFVLISTDKAVHPTSIMGATKRIAELLVQSMNGQGCEMMAVRFGNVLGSNGSVVPTFRRQIAAGGPVTVTHQDIVRYFMTIPEAVSLVLSAGAQAKGGEIFVLDMGKPVRIYDLACNMIRLAGYDPGMDIPIEITGLRPGEKLFEELSLDTETMRKTDSDKIFVLHEKDPPEIDLERHLDRLQRLIPLEASGELVYNAVFEIITDSNRGVQSKTADEGNVIRVV